MSRFSHQPTTVDVSQPTVEVTVQLSERIIQPTRVRDRQTDNGEGRKNTCNLLYSRWLTRNSEHSGRWFSMSHRNSFPPLSRTRIPSMNVYEIYCFFADIESITREVFLELSALRLQSASNTRKESLITKVSSIAKGDTSATVQFNQRPTCPLMLPQVPLTIYV